MRRTPLLPGKPLLRTAGPARRKRVNPKSATKAKVGEVTSEVAMEVFARSRGVCERCGLVPATDLHHRVPRSRGGPGDVFNLVHLCHDTCHMGAAHRENEWPWLVAGSFVRGVYTGPDEVYRAQYPPPN